MNELLDIVNEQDTVISQKYRSEIYEQQLSCFRVINAFLVNNQKQVWIPRRTKHKKLFPLCLDASVGGHVMAGENYQQAFERESKEELNIDAMLYKYEIVTKLTPHKHNVSAFMQLYIIYTDITPTYNMNDFESACWMNITEIQTKIKNGEPSKGDLPILINIIEEFLEKKMAIVL